MTLSPKMRLGLRVAAEQGDGWLYRWAGGYWLPHPYEPDGPLVREAERAGREWVGTQTVSALEARGLLECAPVEESRRKRARRRLTDTGREVVAGMSEK